MTTRITYILQCLSQRGPTRKQQDFFTNAIAKMLQGYFTALKVHRLEMQSWSSSNANCQSVPCPCMQRRQGTHSKRRESK